MTKTNSAWVAGFIEGRGMFLGRDRRKNRKRELGAFFMLSETSREEVFVMFKKFARITGATTGVSGMGRSFAEKTEIENRPAVFTDGERERFFVRLTCAKAKRVLKQIKPFLLPTTYKRFAPILSYELTSLSEASKRGGQTTRERYRTPMSRRP